MSTKTAKRSIKDFFTPKVSKPKEVVVVQEEPKDVVFVEEEHETEIVEDVSVEEIKDCSPTRSPVSPDPEPVKEEVEEVENVPTPVRRSTRACANLARLAWNGKKAESSSSDDEDDFVKGSRKRGRGRPKKDQKHGKGKQTTISLNGTLVKKSKADEEKESSKKKKRKIEHDPDREAFLRSGVPDVIKKARARNSRKIVDSDSDDDIVVEKVEEKKRTLDPETLAFLRSGVPTSIIKAQQTVEKKKEQDDFLSTMGFFPKTCHVLDTLEAKACDNDSDSSSAKVLPFSISSILNEISVLNDVPLNCFTFSSFCTPDSDSKDSYFRCLSSEVSQDSAFDSPLGLCCDDNAVIIDSKSVSIKSENDGEKQKECLPWIDLTRVTSAKSLVVDKNALERLTEWLKQWRKDIRDDGGTSRKVEKKRKRGNSSDSDFITSDEEGGEMKKKSVLLTGPSGCGKTAAVYVLAKHYDFEVVEVNFSSRRSGKDVMQRVEEAVLSHRLKASKNCLLLFKDIDLLHQEEDEGFFSAVAQLITTAVRPIVMTSSLPHYFLMDSKVDKKDPLRIPFSLPRPNEIVEKILKPILSSTKHRMNSKDEWQVDKWLDSIVRHSGCDIRQCINQLQLLLSTSSDSIHLSNKAIHLYSSPFQRHLIDLNFPRQSQSVGADSQLSSQDSGTGNDDDDINMSLSARKKRNYRQLKGLASNLELFSDLDWISRISPSCSTGNVNIFGDIDEAIWYRNHVSGMRSPFFTRLSAQIEENRRENSVTDMRSIRELVLESDAEIDRCIEIDELNEEIGQYLDISVGSMGSNWESCAAVRTIVKNNMLDSAVGRNQKRGGRMASYFNRVDRSLKDRISATFGFQGQLDSVRLS